MGVASVLFGQQVGQVFYPNHRGWGGLVPDISRPENCLGQRFGHPKSNQSVSDFFYFSEAAVKMLGQGCSLIGFVGGKMPRFDTCNRVAIAMRQLAILLQNTNQPRWILTVIYESTGSNKRLVMCHLAFNMNSFNI